MSTRRKVGIVLASIAVVVGGTFGIHALVSSPPPAKVGITPCSLPPTSYSSPLSNPNCVEIPGSTQPPGSGEPGGPSGTVAQWIDSNFLTYNFPTFAANSQGQCGSQWGSPPSFTISIPSVTLTSNSATVTAPGGFPNVVVGMKITKIKQGGNQVIPNDNVLSVSGDTLTMVTAAGTVPTSPATWTLTFSDNPTDVGTATTGQGLSFNAFVSYYTSINPNMSFDYNPSGWSNLCYVVASDANCWVKSGTPQGCSGGMNIVDPNTVTSPFSCTGTPSGTYNGQNAYFYYSAAQTNGTDADDNPILNPILTDSNTCNVTIENMTLTGRDTTGVYQCPTPGQDTCLINNAGVLVVAGLNTTIDNVNTQDTHGDCIEQNYDHLSGGAILKTYNLLVNNWSGSECGRMGFSEEGLIGATLTNLTLDNAAFNSFDFEQDVGNAPTANVLIKNCTFNDLFTINFYGAPNAYGPITMSNCVMDGIPGGTAVLIEPCTNNKAPASCFTTPWNGPVTFSHDLFRCGSAKLVGCLQIDKGGQAAVDDSSACLGYGSAAGNGDRLYVIAGNATLSLFGNKRNIASGAYGISGNVSYPTGSGPVKNVGTMQSATTSFLNGQTGVVWSGLNTTSPTATPSIGGNNSIFLGSILCPGLHGTTTTSAAGNVAPPPAAPATVTSGGTISDYATVTPAGSTLPTGTVNFYVCTNVTDTDNGCPLGAGTLVGSSALTTGSGTGNSTATSLAYTATLPGGITSENDCFYASYVSNNSLNPSNDAGSNATNECFEVT